MHVMRRLGILPDVPSEAGIEAEVRRIHRRRARRMVVRFSRGNAHLAQGLYVTREDLDAALGLAPRHSPPGRAGPGAG